MSNLDFLSIWHRTVLLHVQAVLDGVEPLRLSVAEIRDPDRCELGRWLGVQSVELSATPVFRELVEYHRDFHRIAGYCVHAHLDAQSDALDEGVWRDFQHASDAVAHAADALMEQMRGERAVKPPSAVWDSSLSTGIELIDQQHQAIAELGARMARYPETALDSEVGIDFLTDFYRLLAFHFETEEQLMRRVSTPADWRIAHIREHSVLLETVVSYSYDQTQGTGPHRVADIMHDLLRIIVSHVIDFDFGFKGRSGSVSLAGEESS